MKRLFSNPQMSFRKRKYSIIPGKKKQVKKALKDFIGKTVITQHN